MMVGYVSSTNFEGKEDVEMMMVGKMMASSSSQLGLVLGHKTRVPEPFQNYKSFTTMK